MTSLEARLRELVAKWRADVAEADPPATDLQAAESALLIVVAGELEAVLGGGRVERPGPRWTSGAPAAPKVVELPTVPPLPRDPDPPRPIVWHLLVEDGRVPCCGRALADVPLEDEATTNPAQVTCAGTSARSEGGPR